MNSRTSIRSAKQRAQKTPYPIVHVTWRDSASSFDNQWHDMKDIKAMKPCLMQSFGLIVEENSQCIVVVPHVSGDGAEVGYGEMMIPWPQVEKIRVVK